MPAEGIYHDQVKNALIKDGWVITDDPLHLKWGSRDKHVDLCAKEVFGAEQDSRRIAVSVKSFVGPSETEDLQEAVGQYVIYLAVLSRLQPDRQLFLAVSAEIYHDLFEEPIGQLMLEAERIPLLVFDPEKETIERWIL